MDKVKTLSVGLFFFGSVFPFNHGPKPNTAGHWTPISKTIFTDVCTGFGGTNGSCACALQAADSTYTFKQVEDMFFTYMRTQHATPQEQAIANSCWGK